MGNYYNPVRIKIGTLGVLEDVLKTMKPKCDKMLLLHRGGDFRETEAGHALFKILEEYEIEELAVEVSNPDVEDLYHFYRRIQDFDYQCIIGIGGGSVLDLSKSLAALKNVTIDSVSALRKMIQQKQYVENQSIVPWIGIPTTSGTGSEVTCWATIWDHANGVKLSVDSESLYAHTAIIDPSLTTSLPKSLTASTALDALCHATEAYWSKNSNEVSRVYSIEAIKKIVNHFKEVLDRPTDPSFRKEIALGSLYAGLAFSNTRTTACHSISYPLTLELGMVHGIAASITLGKVMEKNFDSIIESGKLLGAFGVNNPNEVQELIQHFQQIAGFRSKLRDYNANEETIEKVSANAFTKGRMDNNPVALTQEDVKRILLSIF
ncbi:iron-containing alcohol dehydrogenase family protein [Oceanobacillus piezotolerans]|uniref:Iron-containing alcohol dehydrogenase family protein n=1 Tax=Oceanobacillus piezotolerans TaxID=2448030 RepID=A0A498DLH6_9BACI|nr:phosphonoacetaldehyde reductase [Oceanobacillus piezotolerans]RLL43829.1 iron-containing alcohol dehydrogenase family protein [Oceanobacillus piezotolerans]